MNINSAYDFKRIYSYQLKKIEKTDFFSLNVSHGKSNLLMKSLKDHNSTFFFIWKRLILYHVIYSSVLYKIFYKFL